MNINLDKLDWAKADPKNMREHLLSFDSYAKDAWQIGNSFALPSYFIKCKKILFLGMGASGIAGEFIKDLALGSKVVVECVHDYDIPAWVDSETMVIALSHSGETEEVLYSFVSAYQKSAKLIAVTTGGRLQNLCSKYRAPIITYQIDCQPKLAFPFLFLIPFVLLQKLGIFEFSKNDFDQMILSLDAWIKKISTDAPLAINPAKDLAMKLYNHQVAIISASSFHAAGRRLANSINENGKNFSAEYLIPEANHNLVAGFENPKDIISETEFVFIESKFSRPEIKKRFNITASMIDRVRASHTRLDFHGAANKFTEVLLSTIFADFVGMYLGFLNQVDPTSAKAVEYIKGELNK